MFVRRKLVKGEWYFQLIEGYRDDNGKVRHRNLASMGRHATIPDAIAHTKWRKRSLKTQITQLTPFATSPDAQGRLDRMRLKLTQLERRLANLLDAQVHLGG